MIKFQSTCSASRSLSVGIPAKLELHTGIFQSCVEMLDAMVDWLD